MPLCWAHHHVLASGSTCTTCCSLNEWLLCNSYSLTDTVMNTHWNCKLKTASTWRHSTVSRHQRSWVASHYCCILSQCKQWQLERGHQAQTKLASVALAHAHYTTGGCSHRNYFGTVTSATVLYSPFHGYEHTLRQQQIYLMYGAIFPLVIELVTWLSRHASSITVQ